MPVLNQLQGTRIVATPAALAATDWSEATLALRLAPDELFIIPPTMAEDVFSHDAHAIIIADGGFAGIWLTSEQAGDVLARLCEWELPSQRPAFAQGAVAGIPAKLWFERDEVLLMVPVVYAAEMEERLYE